MELRWKVVGPVLSGLEIALILVAVVVPACYYAAMGRIAGIGLLFGLVEMIAPQRFIAWREEQVRHQSGTSREVANAFDRLLTGSPCWGVPARPSPRTIRTLGAIVATGSVAAGVLFTVFIRPT